MSSEFVKILKKQGYSVTERKAGGGFTNNVNLISAHKGDQIFEYVLKRYKTKKEAQDMLRGYDMLSSVVKTPAIAYMNGTEVAYDLIKGKLIKDMIVEGDPKSSEAVSLLAKELKKLHTSVNAPPQYRKGNSPDEKYLLGRIADALKTSQLSRAEANTLVKHIEAYIPKNKSIVHGDAHLGNFIYSDGKVYFIDPDKTKMSDYNADIGKVVSAMEILEGEGKISGSQASELKELFLANQNKNETQGRDIHKVRWPLFRLLKKEGDVSSAKKVIKHSIKKLEEKLAAAILLFAFGFILLKKATITGMATVSTADKGSSLALLLIILGLAIYFVMKKRN